MRYARHFRRFQRFQRSHGGGRQEQSSGRALALDMFNYSCKKYVGAYAAAMNGVDCIVFTAGVGENTPGVRKGICENMQLSRPGNRRKEERGKEQRRHPRHHGKELKSQGSYHSYQRRTRHCAGNHGIAVNFQQIPRKKVDKQAEI